MKITNYADATTPAGYKLLLERLYRAGIWSFGAVLLLGSSVARGQDGLDFSLFESVDSASNAVNSSSGGRNSPRRTDALASVAEFRLIGTSRIGSRITVMLRHASGEEVRVPLERPRMRIPGHEQYAVIASDGSSVSIQYPELAVCSAFPAQGVSCDATGTVATLSLNVSKANEQNLDLTESEQPGSKEEIAKGATVNPFESLRNRSQNGERPPRRFQPRRINPIDVPPGMRVVSTPFGDRLVEE